ncbi:hypothetical protein MKMG_00315 [Methanogenium sp. MK-MG]|nr:hypothetical protein MKMG_00315 [Methanogenium sp. MK-MG]
MTKDENAKNDTGVSSYTCVNSFFFRFFSFISFR